MNLFGFDVRTLDVSSWVTAVHALWWVLSGVAVLALYAGARRKGDPRPWRVVLGLACAGHALVWLVTAFPLPNIYGVNGSMDRENHLGWVHALLAGGSPIRSFQVDQLNFEPLWPNLVALASLHRADLVGAVFQVAPLLVGILFVVSVFGAVSRGLGDSVDARMEAACAAFFALLLAATYNDQTSPFRNPWAMTFMLKPNHALGLVLMPWVLLAIARARNWKDRLWAGFLLQLLGWVFVIHMVFVISGLMLFATVSWIRRQPQRARDVLDVAAVVVIGLILVSPYTFLLTDAVGSTVREARLGIQPGSAHTFDATLRLGLILPLGLFGAWSLSHGPSRFGKLLAAQFVAAQINWQIYHLLGILWLGREMDEAQYWVRFLTALIAGIGAWRLGMLAAPRLERIGFSSPHALQSRTTSGIAAVLLAISAPAAIAGWWNPERMDLYFTAALKPQPERVTAPTLFLRNSPDPAAVVAGDRDFARYVAAYGRRRVLLTESLNPPRDLARRAAVEAAITRGGPLVSIDEGRLGYGIRYLLVTPAFLSAYSDVSLADLTARRDLRLVFTSGVEGDRVSIFELIRPAS